MFDYFMHLKDKNSESKKLKKDKPFLAVIAFCAVIILINYALKITGTGSVQNSVLDFRINISDAVILGTILIGYFIKKFWRSKNEKS